MDADDARDALADRLARRDDVSERAAEAIRAVPRHEFVPESRRRAAYDDRPLPIGEGQTISAPHMVAIMATLLDPAPDDRLLEVGTGCGYHAAVTAELLDGGTVYSVEVVDSLAERARERLDRLGYDVRIRVGDGREGWPENAPYDAAYLTCAASSVPESLVAQVRPGGRLLAPVGDRRQELVSLRVGEDGVVERRSHGGVRFVRMQ